MISNREKQILPNINRFKKYLGTAGIYLAASLVSALIQVLINPWMAKNLSPEDYAITTYYYSFSLLYGPVLGFFMVDFYLRKYYILSEEKRFILKGNIIKLFLVFSGVVSILCFIALYAFVKGTGVTFDFSPYGALTVFGTYVGLNYTLQMAEYKISGKPKACFSASVIFAVLGASASVLLVVVFKFGAVGKATASFLTSFFPFVWVLIKNREYLSVRMDKQIFKQILLFGYPLALSAMLSYFTSGYDKVLLERGGNIVELGYYSVACSMAGYITFFANAIKSTFQPDIFQAIAEKSIRKVLIKASFIVFSVGAIIILFEIFCPFLIRILTAGRYMQSVQMSRIVALSVLTSTVYYQIAQFTYGTGHSKLTLINKIVGTAINILLITILVKRYGAIGAAWSMVFGFLVFALVNLILLIIIRKKIFIDNVS